MKSTEAAHHLRVAENITELVGATPMLHLRRLVPAGAADVYAKLEYLSPGGSVKDRAAIGMIEEAERSGKLTALSHEGWEVTSRPSKYSVSGVATTARMYACPNIATKVS